MKLRRLTSEGIGQFSAYLTNLKAEPTLKPPIHLLTEAAASEPAAEIEIDPLPFATRFDAATYLDGKLTAAGLANPERDAGLWAWLALFYFDQVCPADAGGRRIVREHAQYLLNVNDARRVYRHLLCGPYTIYAANRDRPQRALVLLFADLTTVGHFVYQIASRQEMLSNPAILETATTLYIDPHRRRPKRGAVGQGEGGVFRFAALMNQLDLVWDLASVSAEQFLRLLPKEFDRFAPRRTRPSV